MSMNSSINFNLTEGLEKYFERRCMQMVAVFMRQHGIRKFEVSDDEFQELPTIKWMHDGLKTQIWLVEDKGKLS